jgi:SpoVK/Ycf46/Vps4 family AAA+-type ATPase
MRWIILISSFSVVIDATHVVSAFLLARFGKGDAVDLSAVAFATSGFSGAELESIVNEAAIRAVRRVSTALRDPNVDPTTITPNVRAEDFEGAIATFFASRSKRGNGGMGDILNNVWKS